MSDEDVDKLVERGEAIARGEGFTVDRVPVHMYAPNGLTLKERVICGRLDGGPMSVHVTEYGNQVTCRACLAIMRAHEAALLEERTRR